MKLILISAWLTVISVVAVALTVYDKVAAKRRASRIPEATLMGVSVFGGSVAMLLTMLLIRHKTKHLKFMLGIPVIIIVQAILAMLAAPFLII